jgi:hypothetical protein
VKPQLPIAAHIDLISTAASLPAASHSSAHTGIMPEAKV